jgi:hypothetical protein
MFIGTVILNNRLRSASDKQFVIMVNQHFSHTEIGDSGGVFGVMIVIFKLITIVAAQTVPRGNPDKTGAVLGDAQNLIVGQPVFCGESSQGIVFLGP